MQLMVWINAFIPNQVDDYLIEVPTGNYKGLTAAPLPVAARLWPGNWRKDWNAGYLSDQRGFHSAPDASVRMRSYVVFDLSSGIERIDQGHVTSGTIEVDLKTGVQLAPKAYADMSHCDFRVLNTAEEEDGVYRIEVVGRAADPLVKKAAHIKYNGTFEISRTAGPPVRCKVFFRGHVSEFPAFEAHALFNKQSKALFTRRPPKGNTVTNLLVNGPLGPTRYSSGLVTF